MKRLRHGVGLGACMAFATGLLVGCPAAPVNPDGSGGSGVATGSGGAGTPPGTGGSGGALGSGGRAGGGNGSGGTTTATGTGGTSTASATGGAVGTGGAPTGSGGATGTGGHQGMGGSMGATGGTAGSSVPPGCVLPATVGFKADVRPFLITSCGGGACHVIDTASTTSSGGFDHAYDWITAGAHASSCPGTPTPMRFEVVIAVIKGANPSTCSRSRIMPPPDATGTDLRAPLTACQVATLQAWLNEPLVTQMHRTDTTSPTTPYPMPPYN